jgi:hypothetical protein
MSKFTQLCPWKKSFSLLVPKLLLGNAIRCQAPALLQFLSLVPQLQLGHPIMRQALLGRFFAGVKLHFDA